MNARILLVDDEEIVIRSYRRILEEQKYQIDAQMDGGSALRAIGESQYDLIIVDLMMPKMNGMEVLRRVKETHPEIKVIMVTGMAQEETQEQAMSLGAFHYLPKPFDPDLFSQLVQRALTSTN
jgi:CheY-like chemotaxis protein